MLPRFCFNFSIFSLTGSGAGLVARINTRKDQSIRVLVLNAGGALIGQGTYSIHPPLAKISMSLPQLASGLYFLRIASAGGEQAIRSFPVWAR